MVMIVLPRVSSEMACWMRCSFSGSMLAVASSRMMMGAFLRLSQVNSRRSCPPTRIAPGLRVSSRGYMLGYHDLKDPSVSGFFRFLARVGDNRMRMQIVRLEFGEQ